MGRLSEDPQQPSPPAASNGTGPAQAAPAPQVVDVEQRRYDWGQSISDTFAGKEDPIVLAKLSRFELTQIATLRFHCHLYADQADFTAVEEYLKEFVKGRVRANKPFEKALDNLSRPTEKEGFLHKLFNRGERR